jgi:hypothetical protein
MLKWIRAFYISYAASDTVVNTADIRRPHPPEEDFFEGQKGYDHFLNWTQSLAESAEVIARLDNDHIQRSPENKWFFV